MAAFPFYEQQEKTAIFRLVEKYRRSVGLSKVQLVKRIGYANVNKGLRNYEEFLDGDFEQPFIVDNLCVALVIDPKIIDRAIAHAKRKITIENLTDSMHEAQNWARTFRIHAIINTELDCPSPIFAEAMFDIAQLKIIYLDSSRYAASYIQQAIRELPNRLGAGGHIPAFGNPVSVTINIAPEMAIKYDLLGKEIARSNWAERLPHATMIY
ncbi:MAG: hypothetical protein GXP05_11490 [Alphaproteobacteria bacterium]|nr:hypothetical protein [Alphaproteobacteria bacterium]